MRYYAVKSLHYFNNEAIKSIVEEIKRVLITDGYIIVRVNSVNDINYGAGNGEEIEKNFYFNLYLNLNSYA